jgi:capsular polysaccharide biosynthesis protein
MMQALVKYRSVRNMPVNLIESDNHLFEHEFIKYYYDPFFKVLTNCFMTNQLLVIKNFRILTDNKYFSTNVQIQSRRIRFKIIIRSLFKKQKISFACILAIDNWSKGYFHWMTDVLPKLISLPEKYRSHVLLLPKEYEDLAFVPHSLQRLNFDKIYYFEKDEIIKANELIIPGIMAETGNYNDRMMSVLREQVLGSFKNLAKQTARVFVLRNKNIPRKIINETEIVELVKKYGFTVICFEESTWNEQVELMSSCSMLIGIHGAGLTNILFMPKGASVLELRRKDDSHNNCYFSLASALELNYFYQLCEVDNENIVTQVNDFLVDKVFLEKNIKAILGIE